MLTRRKALRLSTLGFLALASLGAPDRAEAAPLSLGGVSSYLQAFTQAEARFEQLNPDGTTSTGKIQIHRPGRMRFDYDAPTNILVIAASGSVNVFDERGRSEPTVYPLRHTSLSILLERNIDLTRAGGVVGVREVSGLTVVHLQDARDPRLGQLHLIFERNPVRLHGWVLVDDMGKSTRITLKDMRKDVDIPASAFHVERRQRAGAVTHQR